MGRPRGSKNKPKSVSTVTQPVEKKSPVKVELPHISSVPKKKEVEVEVETDEPESDKLDDEEALGESDPLEEALKDMGEEGKKPHRKMTSKKQGEQIAFLFDEIKHLREYVRKIDDAKLGIKFETVLTPEVTAKHFKRKSK